MKVKNVVDEDFVNYKKPSMFIITTKCSMKCNGIYGGDIVCQNYNLQAQPTIEITKEKLCERYLNNKITKAVVFGGLEPFDTELDLISFIDCLRNRYHCDDDIVIYTGYTEEELEKGYRSHVSNYEVEQNIYKSLKNYKNIIIKFGRFVSGDKEHFDEVLGVNLASDNQYGKQIC